MYTCIQEIHDSPECTRGFFFLLPIRTSETTCTYICKVQLQLRQLRGTCMYQIRNYPVKAGINDTMLCTRIYQLDPTLLPPFFLPPLFLCACPLFLARCTQTPNLTKKATRLAIIKCQLIANTYVLGRKETHFPHFFVTVVHLNAGQK